MPEADTLLLSCPECGTVTSRTAEWLGSHDTVPCYHCGAALPASAAVARPGESLAAAAARLRQP